MAKDLTSNAEIKTGNGVKAEDLLLTVFLDGTATVCYKPLEQKRNLSLFSSASAFVAPEATCIIKQGGDSIISYNIYSNSDYDMAHPAGKSLNDIISTEDIPSLPVYSNRMVVQFYVDATPTNTGTHTFIIELIQKDGDVLKLSTPAIKLLQ